MRLNEIIRSLLAIFLIVLLMIIAASLLDIIVAALMPRFYSGVFMISTFVVLGFFSGLFCYSALMGKAGNNRRQKLVRPVLLLIIICCALLYYPVAPLVGGKEYNWPFKSFAITQVLSAVFLWKSRMHEVLE